VGARALAVIVGSVRGLLLALLLVMVAACASTANAGTVEEERCCPMSNFAQRINGVAGVYDVSDVGIAPGAIVTPDNGSSLDVGIVRRGTAGTLASQTALILRGSVLGIVSATWTPGAGGSGDGTLDVLVMQTTTGAAAPVENALVNVGLISAGTIANVTVGGGNGTLTARAISGTGADSGGIVQGLTNATGHCIFAVNGATGVSLSMTASLLPSNQSANLDGLINAQTVTTP